MSIVEIETNEAAFDLLDQLPTFVRRKGARKATLAAARVVAKEYKKDAPSSKKTGTRDKWSAETKAKRSSTKTLKQQIKAKNYRDQDTPGAYVSPPLTHLLELGHDQVLWGRETGQRVKGKPVFRRVIDRTKDEQERVLVTTLSKEIEEEVGSFQ